MKTTALLALFFVVATAQSAPVPRDLPIPVSWSSTLRVKNLEEIPKLLAARLDDDEALELSVNGVVREVSTCDAYLEAKSDGFEAQTTVAMARETWFRSRCRALAFLKDARAARTTFLMNVAFDEKLPAKLPPTFEEALSSDEAEEVRNAENRGESWTQLNAGLVAKAVDKETITVRDEENTRVYTLRVLARADFDRDTVEDWLVAVNSHADTGSFRGHWLALLTRTRNDGQLRLVRRIE